MAGINFHQFENQSPGRSWVDTGTALSLGLLILVLAAYGGLKVYNGNLQEKAEAVRSQAASVTAGIKDDSVRRVYDFDLRLSDIANKNDNDAAIRNLAAIERNTISDVVVTSYTYSDEEGAPSLSIEYIAPDTDRVSAQLFQMKSDVYFQNVVLQSVSLGEDGQYSFSIYAGLSHTDDASGMDTSGSMKGAAPPAV